MTASPGVNTRMGSGFGLYRSTGETAGYPLPSVGRCHSLFYGYPARSISLPEITR